MALEEVQLGPAPGNCPLNRTNPAARRCRFTKGQRPGNDREAVRTPNTPAAGKRKRALRRNADLLEAVGMATCCIVAISNSICKYVSFVALPTHVVGGGSSSKTLAIHVHIVNSKHIFWVSFFLFLCLLYSMQAFIVSIFFTTACTFIFRLSNLANLIICKFPYIHATFKNRHPPAHTLYGKVTFHGANPSKLLRAAREYGNFF